MPEVSLLDASTIARLRALADDVAEPGEDVLGDLMRTYRTDLDGRLHALAGQLAAGDLEAAAETAHALKGASLTIGALRLADHLRALESALRGGEDFAPAHRACTDAAPATIAALEEALAPER